MREAKMKDIGSRRKLFPYKFQFSNASLIRLSILLLTTFLSLLMIAKYLTYPAGDFSVYWRASLDLTSGHNPYESSDFWPYVNGPLLAAVLSLLHLIGFQAATVLWRLIIIFASLSTLWILKSNFRSELNPQMSMAIFALFTLNFASRNNLANSQVVAFIVALLLLAELKIHKYHPFLVSSFIFIAFELKPYLVLPYILIIIIRKEFRILSTLIFYFIVANLTYFILFNGITYLDWIKGMMRRSSGISTASDQATLFAFIRYNFSLPNSLSIILTLAIFAFLAAYFLHKSRLKDSRNWLIISLILGPLITPFSHEQDFMLIVMAVVLMMIFQKDALGSICFLISLSMLINWTNYSVGLGLVTGFIFSLAIAQAAPRPVTAFVTIFLPSSATTLILNWILISNGVAAQFRAHNNLALLFGVFVLINFANSKKDTVYSLESFS